MWKEGDKKQLRHREEEQVSTCEGRTLSLQSVSPSLHVLPKSQKAGLTLHGLPKIGPESGIKQIFHICFSNKSMNIKISLPRNKLLKSVLLSLFYTQGYLNLNQLSKW